MAFSISPKQSFWLFGSLLLVGISLAAGLANFVIEPNKGHSVGDGHSHPHDEEESEVYDVNYTETGFAPSRLEVPLGAQVRFTNYTDTPMWVGSDPHPLHTDKPSFDSFGDADKNETYRYTFEEMGTFGYHNHKKSVHRGVVVVSDEHDHTHDAPDKTPAGLQAVRDDLLALLDPYDPNTIFDVIDTIQDDEQLKLNCHDIAHDIGHRAYELYGFSEAMTFNNPNHVDHPLVQYICAGGYMHGIMEELSLHQPEFMLNPDAICEAMPEVERDSCFHGVGHVYMMANERNVDEALLDCRLVTSDTDMYRCFEGIRMEQFWGNTDHISSDTLGWDVEDPLATCVDSNTDEKPTCFLYSPFGYLREHPKDYFGAVSLCTDDSRLSRSDSTFCLKGLGITMMSKFQGQNLEGSELYMTGLDADLKYAFYQGVLGYAQLSGKSEAELKTTCGRFEIDSSLCYAVHQSMKPTFSAYAALDAARDAVQSSQALSLARQYFNFANQRNLSDIQELLTKSTTYSSADGVFLGTNQIMEMLRNLFGGYTSVYWDIEDTSEIRPGVAQVRYIFYGTKSNGEKEEIAGSAYIIVIDDMLQHIEVR